MTISQNPTFDTFKGLFNEAEFVYRHLAPMMPNKLTCSVLLAIKIWLALLTILYLSPCACIKS